MTSLLGYAEGPDPTDSNLVIVVIALVIIATTCLLATIPIVIARRRRLGKTEGIAAVMVIWGLLAAGSAIYMANGRMVWDKEYTLRLQTGYGDPNDVSGRPAQPWILWGALIALYGSALIWSLAAKPYVAPPPAAGFEVLPPAPTFAPVETQQRVVCKFCQGQNLADSVTCRGCGAPLDVRDAKPPKG